MLQALLKPEDFATYVLLTDDVVEAADFVESHGTHEDASARMDKYLSHETRRREA